MATGDTFQVGENHLGTARSEQAEINAEQQRSTLEELETTIETRERAVEAREALSDERDRTADRRESLADERERLADEREQLADRRESLADEREQVLDEWEARIDARARSLGVLVPTSSEQVLESISRGRAMLTASIASLARSESAITRSRARNRRNQKAVDREGAITSRMLARPPMAARSADASLRERAQQLRAHFVALANELAATEDHLAELHEPRPDGAPSVKTPQAAMLARSAREVAQRLREAAASLAGGDGMRGAPIDLTTNGAGGGNGAGAGNGDSEDSSLSLET